MRLAGVTVPLPALRRERDTGIGEIFDLVPLVDWAVAAGQHLIALLPLGELAAGETSPYNALSTFAIDPLHLTIEEIPELAAVADTSPPAEVAGGRIDRDRVRAWKQPLLDEAFARFRRLPEGCARRRAFDSFRAENRDWLDDHALFRALYEKHGRVYWREWPEGLRGRRPGALDAAKKWLADAVEHERYLQFLAQEQWWRVREHARLAGVLLMGDLPFAPSGNSADVWANRRFFDLERSVGAPPDDFSTTGQRWGLPMFRWKRMRADDWGWFRRRFRRMTDLYDLYRVDHVVGLFRTYAFRDERSGRFDPAGEGAQRAQGRELLEVALAESGRGSIVAEDLGAIPPFVRESMADLDVPGYKVFRWERDGERFLDPREYPECSIATTGTHDTDTLVAWWQSLAPSERQLAATLALGEGAAGITAADAENLCDGLRLELVDLLYASRSRYVILPIQDLFGWSERINLPATIGPGNWTFRLPVPIERLDAISGATTARVRASVDAGGRLQRMNEFVGGHDD